MKVLFDHLPEKTMSYYDASENKNDKRKVFVKQFKYKTPICASEQYAFANIMMDFNRIVGNCLEKYKNNKKIIRLIANYGLPRVEKNDKGYIGICCFGFGLIFKNKIKIAKAPKKNQSIFCLKFKTIEGITCKNK